MNLRRFLPLGGAKAAKGNAVDSRAESLAARKSGIARGLAAPRLKHFDSNSESLLALSIDQHSLGRSRLELYRFLRDQVPILNSVIWTWVRLCASPYEYQIVSTVDEATERRISDIIHALDCRVYRNGLMQLGGFRELLLQCFESLFTDGSVCGEIQLTPSKRQVDRFLIADMRTIEIESEGEAYSLYQRHGERRTRLNPRTMFYYGLNSQPGDPRGISLLKAIPFVARVEQALVSDMHRAMRSAGYQRIHVKITPPEKLPGEADSDYINRANNYFDNTVGMMRDFGPDVNPVTWDDVKIEYVGPSARSSSNNAWYLNHKSMIEDICAGTHLAPFMLGYAYGTTHNWAEFKYELVQRQVLTVQNAAASLLNWIANIELALQGINAEVRFSFENRAHVGLTDRAAAQKTQIENIIKLLDNELITREQAQRELERIR